MTKERNVATDPIPQESNPSERGSLYTFKRVGIPTNKSARIENTVVINASFVPIYTTTQIIPKIKQK